MEYLNFINGKWKKPHSGEFYNVTNPFNQTVIAKAPKSNLEDVKEAIDSARDAFDKGSWPEMTPSERTSVLWKLADLIEKNSKYLAELESKDVGKTIKYARDSDMPFVIDTLRFFAGAARILHGAAASEYVDFISGRHHKGMGTSIIRREPIGVVGSIVPWNYPLYIAVWQIAPALAAGNTLVVKPASLTPLTTLEVCKLLHEAGLPDGVLNVVTGPGEVIGTELARNNKVDMVTLTGDTETGKKIMEKASVNVKRLHLELGGKAPLIVLEDADLEAAAEGSVVGAYWNTGQDCTAVTRVYVPDKFHDKFVKLLVSKTKKFNLGDPMKESTDMGPLISEKQRQRVEGYIQSGIKQGAKLVCGGKRPKGKIFEKGFFLEPTIFTNAEQDMKICKEEIFGPVLSVLKYKKVEDAVQKSNNVAYGLASSVWGKNIAQCFKVANKLKFGTVWINEHGVLVPEMPHGGYKQSGFGKDLSIYSFEEYTNTKHIYVDLTEMRRKPWHYTVYGKK